MNQMIDSFEEKNRQSKKMEENVKLSIAGLSHDLRTTLTLCSTPAGDHRCEEEGELSKDY
ncbi:hypothetical protein [Oceanobacillus halophilus]|uniref:Histidine kinase n=1 Tax=Oceanobacillus halophilus TaxID=930130 RepID=A0A494ZY17_9BACI|nr:hypothetical protein [Oceanobacillus halophilus]RKQ29979.1 hypothetical protein D8M06_16540 [Oceanobacillus halophilus]